MRYLDFENEKHEKGYKPFDLTAENIKANVGKTICYVLRRSIDKYRGYYRVQYGRIFKKHYSALLINEGDDSIDIRDVAECGIKITETAD